MTHDLLKFAFLIYPLIAVLFSVIGLNSSDSTRTIISTAWRYFASVHIAIFFIVFIVFTTGILDKFSFIPIDYVKELNDSTAKYQNLFAALILGILLNFKDKLPIEEAKK